MSLLIRPTLFLLFALAVSSHALAQVPAPAVAIDTEESQVLVRPGATAAFVIDTTIATVAMNGDRLTIVGRSAGSTHVVVITGEVSESIQVTVRESEPRWTGNRGAGANGDLASGGTLETRYLSVPQLVQSTARMFQRRGDRSTEITLGVGQPLGGSPESVFNIPVASYTIRNRADEITLFDRVVDQSPLTVSGVNIRGAHVRRGDWNVHAGYSFFSTFEHLMLPAVREGVGGASYRRTVRGGTLRPSAYYFFRDGDTGPGGLVGAAAYETAVTPSGTMLVELGLSRGGGAAAMEIDIERPMERFWARARLVPAGHPSLSVGQLGGRAADVVWTRALDQLTVGANLSTHRSATAAPYTTSVATAHLDYRLGRRWTFGAHPGFSSFRSAQTPGSNIQRLGTPFNASVSLGPVEAVGGYEPSWQSGAGRAAHSVQGAVNTHWKSLFVSARVDRQMDVPTVSQMVVEAPWLQPLLDRLVTTAVTPDQIAELVRTSDALAAAGYINQFTLNVAPVMTRRGLTVNWVGGGSMNPQLTLSTERTNQQFITSAIERSMHTITYSQQAGSLGNVYLNVMSMCSPQRLPANGRCQAVVSAHLTQQLPAVVNGLLGRTDKGVITGTIFRDDAGRGGYGENMPALANVEVVLDGERRTRTDASGRFTFKGVLRGTHRVEARLTSETPYFFTTPNPVIVRDGGTVQIGVGLSRSRMFGRVVNDLNMPLEGVLVKVSGEGLERTARTEGNGTFTVQGLAPGSYVVSLEPSSLPMSYALQMLEPQTVLVSATAPGRVDFMARPYRSIQGTVRYYDVCAAAYVPAARIEVRLTPGAVAIMTDAAGRFAFRDVPAGEHTVNAAYAGGSATVNVDVPAAGGTVRDVTLSMTPPADAAASCDRR